MQHESHPKVTKRLKRAHGHLASVIAMLDEEKPCVDIAQQLHAVEKAIMQAKRVLIQDHIDHCLDGVFVESTTSAKGTLDEFKIIAKYL